MKGSKIKVVGIGAINLDLIARYSAEDTRNPQISVDASKKEDIEDRSKLITRFLQSTPYRQVTVCAGGSAFNTIAAIKSIDPAVEVDYVSGIGNDDEASLVKGDHTYTNVKPKSVQTLSGETGFCVSLVSGADLERSLGVTKGVKNKFDPLSVQEEVFRDADWIHVSPFADHKCNKRLAMLLKKIKNEYETKSNLKVSLDPGDILSSKKLNNKVVQDFLKNIDYLMLKYDELLKLADEDDTPHDKFLRPKAIRKVFDKCPNIKSVIIERGQEQFFHHKQDDDRPLPIMLPKNKGKIVDDTGAGDVFDAAFIYSKLKNYSEKQTAWLISDMTRIHCNHLGNCGYHAFRYAGPTIFMSHSYKDKIKVEKIAEKLKEEDLGVWIDSRELYPGEELHDKIFQGIRECDTLLFCVSKHSMKSEWVKKEILEAKRLMKETGIKPQIVKAKIGKIDEKDQSKLSKELYVDLTGDEIEGITGIVNQIKERRRRAQTHCKCLTTYWTKI